MDEMGERIRFASFLLFLMTNAATILLIFFGIKNFIEYKEDIGLLYIEIAVGIFIMGFIIKELIIGFAVLVEQINSLALDVKNLRENASSQNSESGKDSAGVEQTETEVQ